MSDKKASNLQLRALLADAQGRSSAGSVRALELNILSCNHADMHFLAAAMCRYATPTLPTFPFWSAAHSSDKPFTRELVTKVTSD